LGIFVNCVVEFKLSTEQYKFLVKAQRKEKASKRYKKITVLLILHQEHNITAIQSALGIDDNTVRRYLNKYKEKGFDKSVSDNYLRYQGKLNEKQLEELSNHINEYLYSDAKSICVYVEKTYGVIFTESGMTKLLHRIGFVFKKTKSIPSKADEAAQVEFLEETLPEILEEVESGTAVLYYADGCHPTHNTNTGKGCIKKGKEFEINCNSGRDRVNINAAVNALKPEHIVYELTDSVNAQSTKRLCQQLTKKHQSKTIYLICDNARYYRNKMLKKWVDNQRIVFVYLPPYPPNLNLIERLWRIMRKKVINSFYYENCLASKESIEDFLKNGKRLKEELRSLMTMNFRTVEGVSFHSS